MTVYGWPQNHRIAARFANAGVMSAQGLEAVHFPGNRSEWGAGGPCDEGERASPRAIRQFVQHSFCKSCVGLPEPGRGMPSTNLIAGGVEVTATWRRELAEGESPVPDSYFPVRAPSASTSPMLANHSPTRAGH